MSPEQTSLIESNVALAVWIAGDSRIVLDNDSAVSESLFGLMLAAQKWDSKLGPFSNFATRVIKQRLLKLKKSETRRKERERWYWENNSSQRERLDQSEEMIETIRERLPPRDFDLLWKRYAEGQTLQQLSLTTGLTAEGIRKKAIMLLKRARLTLS